MCGLADIKGWAEHKGDPDYNIKNPCCRLLNQGDWGALLVTAQAQDTMVR